MSNADSTDKKDNESIKSGQVLEVHATDKGLK